MKKTDTAPTGKKMTSRIGEDISERIEEITGLPYCNDFIRSSEEALAELSDGGWCILSLDAEHFKLLTEWYGQKASERFLRSVADVLRDYNEREGGLSGYFGQDRFGSIVPFDREKISALNEKLTNVLRSDFPIDGFSVVVGVARIDGSCSSAAEYFNHASLAAQEDVGDTHAGVRYYDSTVYDKYSEEYRILCEFERAINNNEITFWLQPQFHVAGKKVVGAEALSRWIKPDGTSLSPGLFVPVLEKYGRIGVLDSFIWESVCRWLGDRAKRGLPRVPISINVSQVDVFSIDVPDHILSLVKKYDLTPADIKVEITESACAEDYNKVDRDIARLRDLGFKVMMDDFGSGYSSLNMLRRVSLDVIKLDAQFLDLDREEQSRGIGIIESIVNMTRMLGTPIIVEGVETREQVRFLSELGCGYMQGYYFASPMTPEKFEKLINDPKRIESGGIVFEPAENFRILEFLDENVYSDSMINNILGAVAFYQRSGDSVDIIRYNEQFYELVGIGRKQMEIRKHAIERYLVEEDVAKLHALLDYAKAHPVIGSHGTVRAIRPNGSVVSFELRLYFISDDNGVEKYYCSAHDVSELRLLNYDIPGAYFRCAVDEGRSFVYVGENFKTLTGYSDDDLAELFDGKFINMVHPAERARVAAGGSAVTGAYDNIKPYRIKTSTGDYIWVAEQGRTTDLFGAPTRQCIALDVTDVMKIRNQMRLLSKYLTDSILILRRRPDGHFFEVAVHGLGKDLGDDGDKFEKALNSGEFFDQIGFSCDGAEGGERAVMFASSTEDRDVSFSVDVPDKGRFRIVAHSYRVNDDRSEEERSSAEFIIVLHRAL